MYKSSIRKVETPMPYDNCIILLLKKKNQNSWFLKLRENKETNIKITMVCI